MLIGFLALFGCSSGNGGENTAMTADSLTRMVFSGDSAYKYVFEQVKFGPRVPGSPEHNLCADYIVSEVKRHGADTVLEQLSTVEIYTGEVKPMRNILARFRGEKGNKKVLLLAHYDTRPWADQDNVYDSRTTPVPGANDGASGAGVMLELARLFGELRPAVDVDLLFVDVEDSGRTEGWGNADETWCLGTQKWLASKPYGHELAPSYGILLDMVGARDAVFHREYVSDHYAGAIVDKIWSMAAHSGYGERFINQQGTAVTDDHLFINRAGLPCVNIIECVHPETRSFHPAWHTTGDDMSIIDPATLKAVGQVVANVIYREH